MKQEIIVDRSRYQESHSCPRSFYWSYLYGGNGLQRKGTPVYFAVGEAVHVGVQSAMLGFDWPTIKMKIENNFDEHSSLRDGSEILLADQRQEQLDLSIALCYVWYKLRLPQFLEEYKPLFIAPDTPVIEQEMVSTIYEDEEHIVRLMSRPDVVCERLSDGKIVIWELKTAGVINDGWIKKWTHALQLLLQVFATEHFLKDKGVKRDIVGIVVEGLQKGMRKKDNAGIKRQSSSLIYAYVKEGDGFIIKDQYSHTWKKGWSKRLVSSFMPLETWIDALPLEVIQETIAVVPPLLAGREEMDSVVGQVAFRAIDWTSKNNKLFHNPKIDETVLIDQLFQQNFDSCHDFNQDCEFMDACFMQSVKDDPIESGLYEEREANHEYERGLLHS